MRSFLRGAVLLGVLLAAGACSPGLRVDSYPTEPGTTVDCEALFADAPQKVSGEDTIRVDGDNAVAWGAPPIILRCGVEKPAALTTSSECYPVRDIGWFVETTSDGYLFTTIGRTFFVSVEVPNDYDPAADALADLAPAIAKHDPLVKPCV
ncbi:DUF3515 family protein [Aeromicrobium chenweiae]|uniref:DUF3515 domain-containing protein n=1 Tax=Aeromicrobium chenweiae TaxID=2079793 RepID=A0A2S0WKR6_9ACTN|nr:DUF3515 family protein [Aeromicrobium chenweiae]AWB91830.1 DUF3515 domain-containing protein [Aeromicrobium chenweiae]TGN32675.1 DUF3515 family protein [Aeromicrobium chenweiae]